MYTNIISETSRRDRFYRLFELFVSNFLALGHFVKRSFMSFAEGKSIISLIPRQFSHLVITRERHRRMTPAWPFGSRRSGHFRCQPEAASLSLRHQRLSFGFSNVRFSHRGDGGLDDRNYTRPASEKDGRL